jgi:hypothetical protein
MMTVKPYHSPPRMPGNPAHHNPRPGICPALAARLRTVDHGASEFTWGRFDRATRELVKLADQPMGDAPDWGLS